MNKVLSEKLKDMDEGVTIELTPEEADELGIIEDTATGFDDAMKARFDEADV